MKKGMVLGMCFLLAFCFTGPRVRVSSAADEILVGNASSLTGTAAQYGISTYEGLEVAMEEINAAGGILGKKIQILKGDDSGDPRQAVNVVQKFITKDKVLVIIGAELTGTTRVTGPISNQGQMVQFTASATGAGLTDNLPYVFRNALPEAYAIPFVVDAAKKKFKMGSVVILTSYNLDYSVDLTKIYEKALSASGIKVQDKISYAEGDIDFSAQVSKIKALKPEAVVMTGYYQESAQLMIEMRKQGINCPILGSNGFNDPKILDLAGKAMEGSAWASGFFPDNPDPRVRKFVAKVQEKYKKKPNQFHAQAYDALWIIAEAIKRAGVTESTPENRTKIRDALSRIEKFPGVSGTHTFRAGKGDAEKSVFILTLRDGKYALLD
ncbi:MAG TPA: ABC transporter substrate-binding protein [Thermodesulfobacteriota bacterium]|jgi:branched-chain amino acid transport system substrate-binding protein